MSQSEARSFQKPRQKCIYFEIGEGIHVHRLAAFRHLFANDIGGKKLEGKILRQRLKWLCIYCSLVM